MPTERTASQQHFFSADRPIRSRAEDKLGRRPFAEAIAAAIRGWRGQDSLVIALYGAWGNGKSSIKNMVTEALVADKVRPVLVTEFNPWQSANRDQLSEAFLDQIGIGIGRGDVATKDKRRRLMNRWRRYAAYLEAGGDFLERIRKPGAAALGILALLIASSAVPPLNSVAIIVAALLGILAILVASSSAFAAGIADWLSVGVEKGRKTLDEVKEELAASARELGSPVLIILDDVDRLTPAETQELFQVVKANADLPNIVYLLVCDRSTTERHIEAALKVNGREYLEKIVQVGFDLPAVETPRVQKILFDGLTTLLDAPAIEARFDKHRWGNLFIGALQPYFANLRQVNRFLSTFAFHVSAFRGGESFEVNAVDLIGIEVLRLFEPDMYRALLPAKPVLTGQSARETAGEQEERRAIVQRMLDTASPARRSEARAILENLFPPAGTALGGTHYANGFQDEWFRQLRICSPDVFDRYFQLAISQGDVPQAILDRVLGAMADRTRLRTELERLETDGLLLVVLDRLEAYKQHIPVEHARSFTTALFDIGEKLPPEGRGGPFEISPSMHAIRIVYWYLKTETDPDRRFGVLRDAIRDTDGLSLPVRIIAMEEPDPDKPRDSSVGLVSDGQREELKQICVVKIAAAAESGTLAGTSEFPSILYRWKAWSGPDAPQQYCRELVRNPEGAIRFLTAFLQRSTSQGMTDHVVRERWYVNVRNIEDFVPLEILDKALGDTHPGRLAEEENRAVQAFRTALARRRQGKPDSFDPWHDDD